jgi:AcrR family transcriptional regulator
VVTRAGVAEREFYRLFESTEQCYLAAFDEGIARVSQVVTDAARPEQDWLERIRAGLRALLGFLDAEPRWGRLLTIHSPIAQRIVLERRQQTISALATALDQLQPSEQVSAAPLQRSAMTAELIVRGVLSVIESRMLNGDRGPIARLEPSLMSFIVAPYLGVVAASIELEQTAESSQNRKARRLAVRTTYRTSRVLKAISTTPRSSNREIADAAGLTDEGQTSRLLARLERQGLIENVGLGSAHGEPNAWLLTPYGQQVAKAIGNGFAVSPTVQGRRRIRGAA